MKTTHTHQNGSAISHSLTQGNDGTAITCLSLLLIAVSTVAAFSTLKAKANHQYSSSLESQVRLLTQGAHIARANDIIADDINSTKKTKAHINVPAVPVLAIAPDSGDLNVSATIPLGDPTEVSLAVQGSGTISSFPALKDIHGWGASGNVAGSARIGQKLTLTVVPAPGWEFVGWRGSHFQDKPPFFDKLKHTVQEGDVLIAVFQPKKGGQ